ncbi:MAG: death-on-curing protein [Peptococcaceae bacterium BICA1-7]|nr:MAG: death-on-curing protein [Peptococcaceae bacterium BICA1-7]HBV97189.1 type II toxin-antitoxin system death-on-curing family toxin [Desulfotomaculum sp.]
MEGIFFLSLAEVIEVHKDQVEHYGGHPGLLDYDLLCSAIAVPEATYGGVYLHSDIFEMAAAYLYHICKNHPFVDGNKRTGLACSLVFLEMNGITLLDETGILYETVMSIISGKLEKSGVANIFRELYQGPV